jgi:hypothetical protein
MFNLNEGHSGVLKILKDNKEFKIQGGSCHNPQGIFDLYISLDVSQPVYDWEYPWINSSQQHIRFPIEDYFIPKNFEKFNSVINYTKESLEKGKNTHVGCIGGKGRTGLFLSSLYKKFNPNSDISAIDYVRDNYHNKAVETLSQLFFLNYNYNIEVPQINLVEYNMFVLLLQDKMNMSLKEIKQKYKNTDQLCDDIEFTEYVLENNFKAQKNYMK